MRKLTLIIIMAFCLAVPAMASASPYNRGCPETSTIGGGYTAKAEHVGMTSTTAARIAKRLPGEFGGHTPARDVPCIVASSVTYYAGAAWDLNWWQHNNAGTVGILLFGYDALYVGRFSCTGHEEGTADRYSESCHHTANNLAGAITVSFLIS
jgi:hypothetical protein